MTPFRANTSGYVAHWDDVERAVISDVALGVADLLRVQTGLNFPVDDENPGSGSAPKPRAAAGGAHFPGHVEVSPAEADAAELAQLEADVFGGIGTRREVSDPAVQRLLPDAASDPIVAEEFRHLTQTDLANTKVHGLTALAQMLTGPDRTGRADVVYVPRAKADQIASALTDVRLVLAQRLGITTDAGAERLTDALLMGAIGNEQQQFWANVFAAAGFAQETLVSAMLERYRRSART